MPIGDFHSHEIIVSFVVVGFVCFLTIKFVLFNTNGNESFTMELFSRRI